MLKPERRIKVLFFIDCFRVGGMHKQILYLVQNLNKSVVEVEICVQHDSGGLARQFKDSRVKIFNTDWTSRGDVKSFSRFIYFLRRSRPNYIFIPMASNFIYYRLARLFYWGDTKQVCSFRSMTYWHGYKSRWHKLIESITTHLVVLTSDVITVNSVALHTVYAKHLDLELSGKFKVIHNGFDFTALNNKKEANTFVQNREQNHIRIGMVARFDPWKDFDTLLCAFSALLIKFSNIELLLVGEGEMRQSIEQKIDQLRIRSKVKLMGEVNNIQKVYDNLDISVLSTFGEGFSNTLTESMANNIPVVATRVAANEEIVIDDTCGLLFDSGDVEGCRRSLERLLISENFRKQVGIAGGKRIRALCSMQKYTESYEALFVSNLEEK